MAEIEGIFGRYFEYPNVRGQLFFHSFVFFCGGESFRRLFFSILKEENRNEISSIS